MANGMVPGELRVYGATLHYCDETGVEWAIAGTLVTSVADVVPRPKMSVWVEGNYICYVDESLNKRRVPISSAFAVVGAAGSMWITGDRLWFVDEGNIQRQAYSHVDVPHDNVSHSDVSHKDTAHADAPHGDMAYQQWAVDHTDIPHDNVAHQDSHSDTPHSDVPHDNISHSDTTNPTRVP